MKYRLTVYHDAGKDATTYPGEYTHEQARNKVLDLFTNGCEMPALPDGTIRFYPPFRIWKIVAEEIK